MGGELAGKRSVAVAVGVGDRSHVTVQMAKLSVI